MTSTTKNNVEVPISCSHFPIRRPYQAYTIGVHIVKAIWELAKENIVEYRLVRRFPTLRRRRCFESRAIVPSLLDPPQSILDQLKDVLDEFIG